MSYFDDASLVMIPSGYKTSKVYSIKPTDGSGDLAFTRSNDTATRVASNGLIEKVRTNLFPTGSALLATGWTSVGATLTAGQTDPNGGTTALRVQLAAGGSPYSYILQSFTGSAFSYARSVFIKGATAQAIRIVDPHSGAGTTVNLTTSYQRFTAVGAGIAPSFGIQFDNNTDNGAKDFTIAFVQIETGDIATDYIATTSAAVSVGPVANVPRLDYLNSSCPRLLLEPQRTNLALNSETITAGTGATVSLNNATSPDGYVNADKLVEDTSTGFHRTSFTTSLGGSVDSSAYCISIFAKAAGRTRFAFWDNSQDESGYSYFDLSNGTIISGTGKIENYGNGWYRCTIFPLKNFSTNSSAFINLVSTGTTESYTGNGTSGVLFWGKQLEVGAYATSYIPTLGAAVTRGADAASKTGISSLIGQTEGTIYWEGKIDGLNASNEALPIALFPTGGDINGAQIYIVLLSNRSIRFVVYDGTTVQASIITSAGFYTYGTTIKLAAVYKANDFALYIDGVQIGTDTSGSVVACSGLYFDYQNFVGKYSTDQVLLFKTRLSNSSLAELTSL
jgi:hypothetical protein